MSDTDKYLVPGPDGEPITMLNHRLAIKQGVNDDQLTALILSHQVRHMLFEAAKTTDHPLSLRLLASLFDRLEDEQQKLWNFGVNPDFHRWFDFPGCTCPRMDNLDRLGTPYKIHAQNCPIHGDL